ncbi:hypothetical protein BU52_15015 [Streptomyces toyocaensis]|uniref:Secreted protein n=1 Tax=Streptomyces toyocaensis TaxID=55952 RepID=A0A081XS52_STRTO|nr:hypothetical protein [Streptomyces toyocaensis]KES06375.1 hypothetical protein BU52_15015 [Streptomyces toyocaensis]
MTFRSRIGVTFSALLSALALALMIPNSASAGALACDNFGCDGHDPNIQSWESGPVSPYGPYNLGNSFLYELRWGKTDGDQYSWARLHYISGSNEQDWSVYVQRCTKDQSTCYWRLGLKKGGASGWTAKIPGGTNYYWTRTPMYYNPSTHMMRACVEDPSGDQSCTPWY